MTMKDFLKKIITIKIEIIARLLLLRHRPKIVMIVGATGKTITRDMVYEALRDKFSVRKNFTRKNDLNSILMTILGREINLEEIWDSIRVLFSCFLQIFSSNYPKWLVMEFDVSHPGDMNVAKWLKPKIAIITALGDVPNHVEFFESPEELIAEQTKLVKYIDSGGALILNTDDEASRKVKSKSRVKVYTCGLGEMADFMASNKSVVYNEINVNRPPIGINFKLNYYGNTVPVSIEGVLGDQYIYSTMFAVAVGMSVGVSIVDITKNISSYQTSPGRLNLIRGMHASTIIDDSYDASPLAMAKALRTLSALHVHGLKVAVLGDMLELGRFSNNEHKKIGELVAKYKFDNLVTVGIRAETIAESAYGAGVHKKKIFCFKNSEQAIDEVKKLLNKEKGSAILVSGAKEMVMEKLVASIVDVKVDSEKVLVRR